jgi:hypothetical protein
VTEARDEGGRSGWKERHSARVDVVCWRWRVVSSGRSIVDREGGEVREW